LLCAEPMRSMSRSDSSGTPRQYDWGTAVAVEHAVQLSDRLRRIVEDPFDLAALIRRRRPRIAVDGACQVRRRIQHRRQIALQAPPAVRRPGPAAPGADPTSRD